MPKKLLSAASPRCSHASLGAPLRRDALPACWQEAPVWIRFGVILLILLFVASWSRASKPEQPRGLPAPMPGRVPWCSLQDQHPWVRRSPGPGSAGRGTRALLVFQVKLGLLKDLGTVGLWLLLPRGELQGNPWGRGWVKSSPFLGVGAGGRDAAWERLPAKQGMLGLERFGAWVEVVGVL